MGKGKITRKKKKKKKKKKDNRTIHETIKNKSNK
jgi:hypothetical protein